MKKKKITQAELAIAIFTDGTMKIYADISTRNLFLSKLAEIMTNEINFLAYKIGEKLK